MRAVGLVSLLAGVAITATVVATTSADAQSPAARLAPHSQGWLVSSPSEIKIAAPPDAAAELAELKAIVAKRSDADLMRLRWWEAGGPTYRWNELALAAMLEDFVTLPLAARHLALLHAAMDDAVAIAWANKRAFRRPRPGELDPSLAPALGTVKGPSYPSDVAAAATAASDVLGYLLPARAQAFSAQAEEAMQSRLQAGVEYPSDVAAGREIGRKVAALAIARGKADGSDGKWTGSVPQGPGRWQGTAPIGATTPTWQPWVLARAEEFRPPAPPAFDADQTKADLAELKSFARAPRTNHRAIYWEVFGGARAHVLWNEIARLKLLEYGEVFDAPAAARALAALNIAFADACVACWDAKLAYWHIRPSQLDADLKPLFAPPNHPSYPAAHGCLSTAAAVVLARVFPADRERLLALGKEAAEARIWAGIHYRYDIDAGQELGRKVADKTLARAFTTAKP
jgi:membrane-associated phospholipid phosphatase